MAKSRRTSARSKSRRAGEASAAHPPARNARGWADRLLAVAGDAEPGGASRRVADFRRFLLLYGAARSWLWVPLAGTSGVLLAPLAVLYSVAAVLAFRPRLAGFAPRLALPVVLAQIAWQFPFAANHLYLEAVCVAFLALVRRDAAAGSRDSELALAGLRWTTALVLFHTGLQKVTYGNYFGGEFLALMIGTEARFARVFAWLLPAGEVARLSSFDLHATGAGPFRVGAPLFVLASNAVWLAELGLPLLLLSRGGRVIGALGGIALMVGIQVAALEMSFALLFVNLLLLFLPGRWNARALPGVGLILAWALGAAAGLLPGHPADWNLL